MKCRIPADERLSRISADVQRDQQQPHLETGEGEDYDGSQMNLIKVDLIIIYLMIQPNLALQAKHKIVK